MNFNTLFNATLPIRALFYLLTPQETGIYEFNPDGTKLSPPQLEPLMVNMFMVLIVSEMLVLVFYHKQEYDFTDMFCSIIQSTFLININLVFHFYMHEPIYNYIYDKFRWTDFADSGFYATWLGWLTCLLVIEFSEYWYHRLAHELNILWAFHQVHHSSQRYVMPTALRQSGYNHIFSFVEWCIPPLLGIPPPVMKIHRSLNVIYQFWIHTPLIDKFPYPIEFIFNTPSHHRLHHGINKDCIDCNYGGLLIIYDRMFGTFREETEFGICKKIDIQSEKVLGTEKIQYGLIHQLRTFNLSYIQYNHLNYLYEKTQKLINQAEVFVKYVKLYLYGPGFQLHDPNPKQKRFGYRKLIPATPKVEKVYEVELNHMTLAFVGLSTYMITEQITYLDTLNLPIRVGFEGRFLEI